MRNPQSGVFLSVVLVLGLTPILMMGSSVGEAAPAQGECDHGAHQQAASEKPSYASKRSTFETPDVTLLGQDGEEHALVALLGVDKPVMLNFIFTSCTTICPVMTSTFREVERQLGPEREQVQLVSISIDPEYDTPARLAEYARARGAGEPWIFLTGDLVSIRKTQTAFDAYRGNKMNHVPITFLRAAPDKPWLRIDGFAAASDIMREYRGLLTQ